MLEGNLNNWNSLNKLKDPSPKKIDRNSNYIFSEYDVIIFIFFSNLQDLLLYLLQLVQALKYENFEDIHNELIKVDNGKEPFFKLSQDSRDSLSERYNFDKTICMLLFFSYK